MRQELGHTKAIYVIRIGILVMVLTLMLFFTSCMEGPAQGALVIDLGGASSRSITPSSVKVECIQISGIRNDNETIKFSSQSFKLGQPIAITGLSAGTWTFNVVGYAMDPSVNTSAPPLTSVASNDKVVIQSGKTTSASFSLYYLTEGSGSAAITVTWPNSEPLAAKAVLGEMESSAQLSTLGTALLPFSGVLIGDYSLDVEFANPSGSTISFPMIEMVNIFNGLESTGTIALVEEDFPRAPSPSVTATAEQAKGEPVYAYRTVTITGPEGASLYYTIDGNDPGFSEVGTRNEGTKLYEASFDITEVGTTTVKAMAAKDGFLDSAIAAQDFVINGLGEGGVEITDPVAVTDVAITQADSAVAKFVVSYTAPASLAVTATWYMEDETTAATDIDGDGNQMTFTPALTKDGRHQVRVNISYKDGEQTKTAAASIRFTATRVPAPLISVSDATGGKLVSISATGTIHCTTDGSDPVSSPTRFTYDAPLPLSETKIIRAYVTSSGYVPSSEAMEEVEVLQASVPTIGVTEVEGGKQVAIDCATTDAVIHYTIDNSDPTASSPVYETAFPLTSTKTVKAIAVRTGMANSVIAEKSIAVVQVESPAISPSGGLFSVSQQVTMTCATEGAAIHYTLDGTVPTVSSPQYDGAIPLTSTTTVRAIATKIGMADSAVSSQSYTLMDTVATPIVSTTDVAGGKQVAIDCATTDAVIYYTIDNTTPTTSSASYTTSFKLTSSQTIKAIAVKADMNNSAVAVKTVTVVQVATPVITPASTTFGGTLSVTISGESGATIYYTTNGDSPTTSSTPYSGPIMISETTTVKAIAVKIGMSSSAVASQLYTFEKVYSVGDTGPAGGIIFYVNADHTYGDWTYLEAASSDIKVGTDDYLHLFGYYRTTDAGTSEMVGTNTAIGTGAANTKALVETMGSTAYSKNNGTEKTGEYAARLCDIHDAGGYADWFLPSKDELNMMYQNVKTKSLGGFSDVRYWSSSEADAYYAWGQYYKDGNQFSNYTRLYENRVRPVRAF